MASPVEMEHPPFTRINPQQAPGVLSLHGLNLCTSQGKSSPEWNPPLKDSWGMVTYRNQIFMEISSQIMGCSADFGSMQGSQTVFLSQEVLTDKSTSSPGHNHRHPLNLGKETGGDPARKAFPKELYRHSSPSFCSLQHLFLNFTNPWLCSFPPGAWLVFI